MPITQITLDINSMTISEVNQAIHALRKIRTRKEQAHTCKVRLTNVAEAIKEYGFRYVNRYSGQVFDANDWFVYDEEQHCTHGEEVDQ